MFFFQIDLFVYYFYVLLKHIFCLYALWISKYGAVFSCLTIPSIESFYSKRKCKFKYKTHYFQMWALQQKSDCYLCKEKPSECWTCARKSVFCKHFTQYVAACLVNVTEIRPNQILNNIFSDLVRPCKYNATQKIHFITGSQFYEFYEF